MSDKTPVKVYKKSLDNGVSCFLCDFNFAANGTRPAYKIFNLESLRVRRRMTFMTKLKKFSQKSHTLLNHPCNQRCPARAAIQRFAGL